MAIAGALDELIGEVVADRYELREVIGAGGMGAVFLAVDTRLPQQRVAVKLLIRDPLATTTHAVRFRREARILARLQHPNIVSIRDTGQLDDGRPFIVMEYLEGESLATLRRRQRLTLAEVIDVIAQVARGLEAAREHGVVHRDLKPHNLYLCKGAAEEGVGTVKILDFGISKLLGAATVETDTATLVGTPQYMAPEQARGEHDRVGPRSDVFSLGVIAYELLSGDRPFDGEALHEVIFKIIENVPPPLSELRPELPARISAAVEVAMAKDLDDRFENATAFARALTGERPIPVSAPAPRPSKPETVVARPVAAVAIDGDEVPTTARPRQSPWRRLWLLFGSLAAAATLGYLGLRPQREPLAFDSDALRLARARSISEVGLAALATDAREALRALAAGYRGGDRRLAVRVALRQALGRSGALVLSVDTDSDILSADLSGDQSELAVSTKQRVTRHALDGRLLATHDFANVWVISYSPGDVRLAALDASGRLRIIDRTSGEVLVDRAGRNEFFWAGDDYITAIVEDRTVNAPIFVRETLAGEELWRHDCVFGPPLAAMAVGGARMIACSQTPTVLDVATGEVVARLPNIDEVVDRDHVRAGLAQLVSVDNQARRALVFGPNSRGYIADLERRKITPFRRDESAQIRWARLDGDGDLAIVEAEGTALEVHRIGESGHELARIIAGRSGPVTASSVDDRGRVMVGDANGWIQVEHINTKDAVFALRAHDERVLKVELSGSLALSIAARQVRLWRIGDPAIRRVTGIARLEDVDLDASGEQMSVDLGDVNRHMSLDGLRAIPRRSIDGLRRLSADGDYVITDRAVIERASGRSVLEYPQLGMGLVELADGAAAALVDVGPELVAYVRRGERLVELRRFDPAARESAALSRSGRYLATRAADGTVTVLELPDAKVVKTYDRLGRTPVLFSPDDRLLFTNDADGVLLFWWREGRRLELPRLANIRVRGDRITGIHDGSLVVVDATTGELEGRLPGCGRALYALGGRVAAVRCRDQREVVLWDIQDRLIILAVGRRELGDRPVAMAVDRRDRFALIGSRSGLFRVDLSAETRSPAEVDAAVAAIEKRE